MGAINADFTIAALTASTKRTLKLSVATSKERGAKSKRRYSVGNIHRAQAFPDLIDLDHAKAASSSFHRRDYVNRFQALIQIREHGNPIQAIRGQPLLTTRTVSSHGVPRSLAGPRQFRGQPLQRESSRNTEPPRLGIGTRTCAGTCAESRFWTKAAEDAYRTNALEESPYHDNAADDGRHEQSLLQHASAFDREGKIPIPRPRRACSTSAALDSRHGGPCWFAPTRFPTKYRSPSRGHEVGVAESGGPRLADHASAGTGRSRS